MKIVFVCAGNVCRSPMAEALFREKLTRRGIAGVEVSSCGLEANPWNPAEPRLRQVIGNAYGNLEKFRSRPISADIVQDADLVLAMEERQVEEIVSRFPKIRGRVATLTGFVGEKGDIVDFVDGYQGSFLDWLNECHSIINRCLDLVTDKVSASSSKSFVLGDCLKKVHSLGDRARWRARLDRYSDS